MAFAGASFGGLLAAGRRVVWRKTVLAGALVGGVIAGWLLFGDPIAQTATLVSAGFAAAAFTFGELLFVWEIDAIVDAKRNTRPYTPAEQLWRRRRGSSRRELLKGIAAAGAAAFTIKGLLTSGVSTLPAVLVTLVLVVKFLEAIANEELARARLDVSYDEHYQARQGQAAAHRNARIVAADGVAIFRAIGMLALALSGAAVIWRKTRC